ncbi:ABC transporter permease [Acetobacterium woodii]|uniref:ABC transport system permease protein n=1 Tax=Acetobacterium woodii (strain ATCC 29683 / DSM 1030 / JCM 2381 / KCTC 1655 / WB1) TaxID=931626 RepID=H6LIB0_ACEWD|nr:ABC transporter permease [Acetobacterium woodii]AFA47284.1 ABC transport system permease protein [Acetobacterium woodii DSM 1030]
MLILVRNEVTKLLLKKKLILIFGLLIIFITLLSYGQQYTYHKNIDRFENFSGTGNYDWKSLATQQLSDLENRLDNPYIPDSGISSIEIEIKQLRYFIENDINPITPSAAKFSVDFVEQGISLLIPLIIVILAADLVSGEFSTGTIKILLTRAVPRWKILLSKLIALFLMTTLIVFIMGILSILIAYLFFRQWGFNEPIITGFRLIDGQLNADSVILITRFEYTLLIYSLTWYVSIVIASLTLLISIIVDNTASAIGILMAALIGGQFLQLFLSDWPIVKFFFVTNLDLTRYLTGSYQPIPGMSLNFSIITLFIWGLLALIIGFGIFDHKDILV